MCTKARGFSLPELLLLLVVLGIGLAGILSVINQLVIRSVDPMLQKQAMAVAESMMEEVLLQSATAQANAGGRQNFNDVFDYNGFNTGGIRTIDGTAIAGLEGYNLSVAVKAASLNGVPTIQVTVIVSGRADFVLDGYKFAYD
jgi:MSHA pilin protein MshD